MTHTVRYPVALPVLCLPLLLGSLNLRAQNLSEFNGLLGQDITHASVEMEKLGYVHIESTAGENLSNFAYWWSPNDKQCVCLNESNDHITKVTKAHRVDCNQKSNTGRDVAIAAGAAALVGGIIAISNKSHHHDDNKHHDDEELEAAFERGYRDGIHHARYDNIYNESDQAEQYSKGYNSGQKQRSYNIEHHSGNAGGRNRGHVDVSDLRGVRASSGEQEMKQRGFRQVANYSNSSARINYYYHQDTGDCIRITVSDGRFTRVENGGDFCDARN